MLHSLGVSVDDLDVENDNATNGEQESEILTWVEQST